MTKYSIVKTTFSDKQKALDLAQILILAKVAACVQLNDISSIYSWEGKIVNETEYLLSIKTKSSNYAKLERLILQNHQYQVPQIVSIAIENIASDYASWIDKNC